MVEYKIQHQPEESLFFIALGGDQRAYIKYRYVGSSSAANQIDFYTTFFCTTFVPETYRGQGIAAQLLEHGFNQADQQGVFINTSCWYAAKVPEQRKAACNLSR